MLNQQVTVGGIVTYVLPNAPWQGFYLQTEAGQEDEDPSTSEGLFVYEPRLAKRIKPGQRLYITGQVSETYGQTQVSKVVSWSHCGQSKLPASLPLPLPRTSDAQWEALEGMRVHTPRPLTLSGSHTWQKHQELLVSANGRLWAPSHIALPGDPARAIQQQQQLRSLLLQFTGQRASATEWHVGTKLPSQNGVLGYGFKQYRLFIDSLPSPAIHHLNEPPPADRGVRVATFNVRNLFNGDGNGDGFPTARGARTAKAYRVQLDKTAQALTRLSAQVIGLNEVENDGFGPDSSLQQLVAALNRSGARHYQAAPPYSTADSRHVIRNALIYEVDRVSPRGSPTSLTSGAFQFRSRPPIWQVFQDHSSRQVFAVVVNHFKSKGGCKRARNKDDQNLQDGQGCFNGARVQAARELLAWVASLRRKHDIQYVVLLGDFNSYSKEDPIRLLEASGFVNMLPKYRNEHHTTVYRGQSGSLDHILANNTAVPFVTNAATDAIHADAPITARNRAGTPYGVSDHDPVFITLQWPGQ